MTLLSPWLLLALGALVVPIAIHLVRREDREGHPFPSLMFLQRVPFEVRSRRRIRDLWLLCLRCLALAALVMAFAGPQCTRDNTVGNTPLGQRDVVIVLDRSYSMSGGARFERARERALEHLDALQSGDRAALVLFDQQVEVAQPLNGDLTAVRAGIESSKVGSLGTRIAAVLPVAERLLLDGTERDKSLVLISDLQLTAFTDDQPLRLANEIDFVVEPVVNEVRANVALLDAGVVLGDSEGVDDTLLVRVANTGVDAITNINLRLVREGRESAAVASFELAAGEQRSITVPLVLAKDRHTSVSLTLDDDEISADNHFHLALAPKQAVAVALVVPPTPRVHRGVFVTEALALAKAPAFEVVPIAAVDLSDSTLQRFAAVIVDDVAIPSRGAARALRQFVERGAGLLVAVGPDSHEWPSELAESMPVSLSLLRESDRGAGIASHIAGGGASADLWVHAGASPGELLRGVRIHNYRDVRPAADARVLVRLDDGAPILIERRVGDGRILLLATTLDTRWSSLPLEPGFVPLLHAALQVLSRRYPQAEAAKVGAVIDVVEQINSLADAKSWHEFLAGGGELVVEPPSAMAHRVRLPATAMTLDEPGLYEVHRVGARERLPIAANVERRESWLATMSVADLEARIVRRVSDVSKVPADVDGNAPPQRSVAWWLLVVGVVLLLVETYYASRLARGRIVSRGEDSSEQGVRA